MNVIYEWVKNITYFLIFMTVVTNLLPDKKYEKYIKLFAGMVLILLVLQPITGGLRLDDKIAYYFESISFQKEANDLTTQLLGMEDKRLSEMVNQYQQAIAMDIAGMAQGIGLAEKRVEVKIDGDQESEKFGKVVHVSMTVTAEQAPAAKGDVTAVTPIERVQIGLPENKEENAQERREKQQEENSQIHALRRKIAEYYDLEENSIEIQLEDEQG